jgi:cell division protein FtsB
MEHQVASQTHATFGARSTLNIEELQARVAQLEFDLREEKEARTRSELGMAQLRTENEELRADLLSLDTYTLELRQQRNSLQTKLESQKESVAATASTQKSEALVEDLEERYSSLESKVSQLMEENAKLQQELVVKQPLFDTGRKVRIRYLEQAREMILFVKPKNLDKIRIENGNIAAHGGNGKADAALFQRDVLSKKEQSTYWVVFKALYTTSPDVYGALSPKYLEVIDHEATIRTLKVLNGSLDRPLKERMLALGEIDILKGLHVKMDDDVKFDADQEVDRRLGLVREWTQKIVEYDRQRDGRGSKEDRRSSELTRVCSHQQIANQDADSSYSMQGSGGSDMSP